MSYRILHVLCNIYATKLYYNIASRAAQSNSVYISALKIVVIVIVITVLIIMIIIFTE